MYIIWAVANGGGGQCPHHESLFPPHANFRNLLRISINSGLLLCNGLKWQMKWCFHTYLYKLIMAILSSNAFPNNSDLH